MNLRDCKLYDLGQAFDLERVRHPEVFPVLQDWMLGELQLSDFEENNLRFYQKKLQKWADDWNEMEYRELFIGPVISLINFDSNKYNYFAGRDFTETFDNELIAELIGKPDGMLASGQEVPQQPFFCLHEYKRDDTASGDAKGQTLGAMLIAQKKNDFKLPIYGVCVRGRLWEFMVLDGKKYSVSLAYDATKDDLFDIFRIMKKLKGIIENFIK